MSDSLGWRFYKAVPDGSPLQIGGLDVWRQQWRDTEERVRVRDPQYQQEFTFDVYEIGEGDGAVTFAAGEFSNCMWGFYLKGE